jgi:hypothetical protein
MDAQPILKKTLVTVGVMVGAWVAFVGTLSFVLVVVTSHIVGSNHDANDGNEASGPGRSLPGLAPSPLPGVGPTRGGRDNGKSPASPAAPHEPHQEHHHETI